MDIEQAELWLAENRISKVECLVPDMGGMTRGKTMNTALFLQGLRHHNLRIPELVHTLTVQGEAVFSHVVQSTERDLHMRPDLSRLYPLPWSKEPTASVICDSYNDDGTPNSLSPRQILRHVLALFAKKNWQPIVGPEAEFYLIDSAPVSNNEPTPPMGRSRHRERGQYVYGLDAIDEFAPLFSDLYENSALQEIDLQTLIHEDGPCQFEINIGHNEALKIADQLFLFKRLARQTAKQHGMFISFMAKPYAEESGSSIHLHHSVLDMRTGHNIFTTKSGKDSVLFRHYIGGLQKYIPASMPIFAPYVNSYQRFKAYMSAPINTHWSRENRTVGLRIPQSHPAGRRIENRIAGADINPYLCIAASLICGYAGMVEKLHPRDEYIGEAYASDRYHLPKTLQAALQIFNKSPIFNNYIGQDFVHVYSHIKEAEYEHRSSMLSPWDVQFLLTQA